MLNRILKNIANRLFGLQHDCQGFVVMSTLAIFLFLFVLCASIYAVGETIHQRIKLQNACDAAAYSAAVVQADGLSRMACVNRAMAWSYVQMTNRQMDYITYRWLKLTCKRFREDRDNAKAYAAQLTLCIDKELGPWAILEALIAAALDRIFDLDCASGIGHEREVADGRSWWCGLKPGSTQQSIDFNLNTGSGGAASAAASSEFTTYDKITEYVLTPIGKLIDQNQGDNIPEWGYYLGLLIDYDKKNINRMNKALERINTQMTISMKLTAENVLKAMLKDNRIDSDNVLKDYYISIQIPEAVNPYSNVTQRSEAPRSFFSPLRNTEADERLFLQMQSTENAAQSLSAMFPTLLGGAGTAHGLDQWFIRGTGIYQQRQNWDGGNYSYTEDVDADNDDFCYAAQKASPSYSGDESGWVANDSDRIRLLGTKRDEGALGIQRVYKDSATNDTRAGIFGNNIRRGNHLIDLNSFLEMGKDAIKSITERMGNQNGANDDDDGDESFEDTLRDINSEIDRLEQENDLLQNKIDRLNTENDNLRNEKGTGYEARIAANNVSLRDAQEKIATNKVKIAELMANRQELEVGIGNIGDGIISNPGNGIADNVNNQVGDLKSQVTNFLGNFVTSLIGKFAGQYVDVSPSCGNAHEGYARDVFMCSMANETTALYSQYRWASSKWYCCTTFKAYLYSMIFRRDFGGRIYCDTGNHTFKKFLGHSFTARGWGHFAFFPKWFCGSEPLYPGDSIFSNSISKKILDVIPPLTIEEINGNMHGYMKSPLDFPGFAKPFDALLGDLNIARDNYNSCSFFSDGPFSFWEGKTSYAGYIQGHARIYADDKEIFDNRYVGAKCKPWVLNERFFAGEGSIIVGAAMKHTNPFVQLFNFLNTKDNKTGTAEQKGNESTVLSAFNIPDGNFMWTMSAARAGVRHRRRNGAFDQERQYQITYDSTADVENLNYSDKCVFQQDNEEANDDKDTGSWDTPEAWGNKHDENKNALSRASISGQTHIPIWNGCPCAGNATLFKNMWNLCESDWDATLLPLRYAGQKAALYLSKGSGSSDVEDLPFNEQDYSERKNLVSVNYNYSSANGKTEQEKRDMILGNGKNWQWNGVSTNMSTFITSNPFISGGWKRANASFFENLVMDHIPGEISTGISTLEGLNLQNKIPTGKEEKTINIFTILKDRIL